MAMYGMSYRSAPSKSSGTLNMNPTVRWDRMLDSLKTGSLGKLMTQLNIEPDQDLDNVE
jgi:hypothetical protein